MTGSNYASIILICSLISIFLYVLPLLASPSLQIKERELQRRKPTRICAMNRLTSTDRNTARNTGTFSMNIIAVCTCCAGPSNCMPTSQQTFRCTSSMQPSWPMCSLKLDSSKDQAQSVSPLAAIYSYAYLSALGGDGFALYNVSGKLQQKGQY